MLSLALRFSFWMSALLLAGGCQLLVDPRPGKLFQGEDASITFLPGPCNLACARGRHCELGPQEASCVADNTGTDASAPSPPVVCNLLCVRGSHCVIGSTGPSCTPDQPSSDAGAPVQQDGSLAPPAACNLACIRGSHCVVGSSGPSCVKDAPSASDAGSPAHDSGSAPAVCNLFCIQGTHCQVTAAGPTCVPNPVTVDASAETPCGLTTCAANETCCSPSCGICEPKGGFCPAIACVSLDAGSPAPSCASTTCPKGTYCDDLTGQVQCKKLPSCDSVKCSAGTSCQLVQVQCIRAPCPPLPECLPTTPQVCNLACKQGTHCVVLSSGPTCQRN